MNCNSRTWPFYALSLYTICNTQSVLILILLYFLDFQSGWACTRKEGSCDCKSSRSWSSSTRRCLYISCDGDGQKRQQPSFWQVSIDKQLLQLSTLKYFKFKGIKYVVGIYCIISVYNMHCTFFQSKLQFTHSSRYNVGLNNHEGVSNRCGRRR